MLDIIGVIEEIGRRGEEEVSVEWRIPNLTSLLHGSDSGYLSPEFRIGEECWHLSVCPNWGRKGRNSASGWVRLALVRYYESPPETVRFSVGIRGSGGVEKSREGEQEFKVYGDYCAWWDFCSRSEIMENRARLMPDDTLTVTCVLKKPVELIKTLEQRVENYELELEVHKRQISALESEKLSIAEEYKCLLEEKLTLEKGNERLKKEVEYLIEQNKHLNEVCEEQSQNISKASSELRKACMDSESHKKEMESLMEQIKILKMTVENYQTISENYNKQMSTLESEMISSAEPHKCREKLTIVSELEKGAIDDDTVEKNNSDEDNEESKNKKNVKQLSQVKSTKQISLPARHGDVIRSLKAILAGGRRSDFSLKSGGGEWPVHRAILEGRSGHFGALFRGEWAERSEVRLDEVPEGVLDGVLHFVYAGEVGDLYAENVCGTYVAAHRFLLRDLKSLCVEYMGGRMCPEMVCGALAVAGTHGEGDLKERAKECFFRESGRIVATEEWKELREKHPAIIAELFQEFIKRERKNRRKEGE